MADAYKWLFQASLGGEHAISSLEGVTRWMDREWDGLEEPFPGEELVVPLRPDGSLVRVNLRPYRAGGGDKAALLDAFVASAREFRADREEFLSAWKGLRALLPIGELPVSDWETLDARVRPEYPAIDHSAENLRDARPAYRVVLRDLLR